MAIWAKFLTMVFLQIVFLFTQKSTFFNETQSSWVWDWQTDWNFRGFAALECKKPLRVNVPCSKTFFLKLPSIHRFRCLVLSEIVTRLFTTKNLQSQWRSKFMNFWLTYFRSRFALCSLLSVIFLSMCLLHSACCPPPHPHQFCMDYCFQILSLGGLYFPKRIWKQYLIQNLGDKRSALWGIRK